MKTIDKRILISGAIESFQTDGLFNNSINLFKVLGYSSEKRNQFTTPTYQYFKNSFIQGNSKFNELKALVNEWKSVELLFQLTKDEVMNESSLFETNRVDNTIIETYLFFAIELSGKNYARTKLAEITREVNKLFLMPVMILFRYGNSITFSIINRRLHKLDDSKDVLEKVTLIKDIDIIRPHRAHIEILLDLSLEELFQKHTITNFIELHNAWQKTLDIKELNKKFFIDLANWYFWAVEKTTWPDDIEKDKEIRNAINIIRLITRVIFVWFLKEKGLIHEDLFSEKQLKNILKFTDSNKSTYYKAILQNLFFATLNTEMGNRKFRTKNDSGRDGNYYIHNLFRYEKEFIDPKSSLVKYFADIPFLNGGLFECLDRIEWTKKIRVDGFSDRIDNCLKVPDEIFFKEKEKEVDLNDVYGTHNKTYKVRGLIDILNCYKFTIAENTPLDEEIALDPELLGKVFENLLANYNPETKTTARKLTGSFYTPPEIVNYMVDESILAYLKDKLLYGSKSYVELGRQQTDIFGNSTRVGQLEIEEEDKTNRWENSEKELTEALHNLISYSESKLKFSEQDRDVLINAIDNCKILDPACGSGAFPMGILHKLVLILHKLDPHNLKWKQRQIDKASLIDDPLIKENTINDIEEAFANNELDYGRKLYLIENCIYGVDIQPIAVQIAKLRFFISLIVDQKIDKNKENLGIRPLPNLETKFVAANTLIGIEKPESFEFRNKQVVENEKELFLIRKKHFNARTFKTKVLYREKDAKIRKKISDIIKNEYAVFCEGLQEDIKLNYTKIKNGERSLEKLENNHRYSDDYKKEQKTKILKEIQITEKQIEKLLSYIESNSVIEVTANRIANWDPYDHNTHAEFFDPEWMFGISGGFDIVIGNPPYIRVQNIPYDLIDIYKKTFKTAWKRIDISTLFFEFAFSVLKNSGITCYISSNQFISTEYGRLTRKFLRDTGGLKKIIDFGDLSVFENTLTYVSIFIFTKQKNTELCYFKVPKLPFTPPREMESILLSKLKDDSWVLGSNNQLGVMERITLNTEPLKLYAKSWAGIITGLDKLLLYDYNESDVKIENDLLIPVIRAQGCDRYKYAKPSKKAFYPYKENEDFTELIELKELKHNYPMAYKFVIKFQDKLKSRKDSRKLFGNKEGWYGLIRYGRVSRFKNIKIVSPGEVKQNKFGIDITGSAFSCARVFSITCENSILNIYYLLAVLNSKLIEYYLHNKAPLKQGGYYSYSASVLDDIPIKVKNVDQTILSKLALYLLNIGDKAYISFFERLIDALVYELYFPDIIKNANASISEYLTKLPEIDNNWTIIRKTNMIENVYRELNEQSHPINKSIFKMDVIDEIRIIEGKQ